MEITAFFKFLYKNVVVLVLIPIITVVITYFLVKSLPDSYIAQTQISAGIIDKTGEIDLSDTPPLQQSEIEQKFSNLIQRMQITQIISLVSYRLIIHDLLNPSFKPLSARLQNLTKDQKTRLINTASAKYKSMQPLARANQDEIALEDALVSMKYDVNSIKSNLSIARVQQSDYINVVYTAPTAELSAYVVNTLCSEFINYYNGLVRSTGQRKVNYLSKLLENKQKDLNNKMVILKYYKIQNNVLNLPEQARIIFGQMIEVENRQAELQKEIIAGSAAIKSIENRFNARDRKYFEAQSAILNAQIITDKEKARLLYDKYIDSDWDPVYKRMHDSVQSLTTDKILRGVDENIFNPMVPKQDLIGRKIGLQTELDLNRAGVNSLERLHTKLFAQFRRLVPFEASIQNYERDIEIASQEYLDILDRYNNTSMQTSFVAKPKQVHEAPLGALQPSKKMLLIILSGVISFVFCVLILFVLFYFDDSVLSARQLANTTELPVIGQLDTLNHTSLNIQELWEDRIDRPQYKGFKDQLRAIRLELNQELHGAKLLAVTSFSAQEGKTFLALNLAYAYALTNKKVLLIDGNFVQPGLTKSLKSTGLNYIEDFLLHGEVNSAPEAKIGITVLGNTGGNKSLFEISDETSARNRFESLKSVYDLILIETPALVDTETSKEWILLADKVIGVFEYKGYISDAKKAQLSYLKILNEKFIGWIFNKFPAPPVKKPSLKKA
ncbi:GumC family protein [Paradesertivirga mongoliensis]|uniref:GumC family protein n=1 Tax=Paradesertivirga mongoliensis TaxID=2100740 RepID=A0ABW4ZLH2_9SPHI|nr:lipopolysaccharide biosynthesis protein [Pedobacter mongoliensis]